MTPEYKVRRDAKHAAQFASKSPVLRGVSGTIDLTPKMARHAFVGLKTHPQANGGRKNRSGYAQERKQADIDNAAYDVVQSEQSKSIGGVSEDLGLPTDNAEPISN